MPVEKRERVKMKVDIQDLIGSAGIKEPVYPGKKLVRKYPISGDHKVTALFLTGMTPIFSMLN